MKNPDSQPIRSVTVEVKPAFCDVDPLGVVWHGNYFRYFEYAREALLESFDYGYMQMRESGYAWPIVDTRVKYVAPVTFPQRILVTATLVEYENRMRISYEVRDAESGRLATKGYTVQMAVKVETRETCFVCPPVLFEKLGVPRP